MFCCSTEEASLLQNFGAEVEARFHSYLQQGSEEYYEINLMFIGQAGVGKTTLTKGLLGELDPSVSPPSTNGIDLHQHRCKYDRHSRHIYPISKGSVQDSFSNFHKVMKGPHVFFSKEHSLPFAFSSRVPELSKQRWVFFAISNCLSIHHVRSITLHHSVINLML